MVTTDINRCILVPNSKKKVELSRKIIILNNNGHATKVGEIGATSKCTEKEKTHDKLRNIIENDNLYEVKATREIGKEFEKLCNNPPSSFCYDYTENTGRGGENNISYITKFLKKAESCEEERCFLKQEDKLACKKRLSQKTKKCKYIERKYDSKTNELYFISHHLNSYECEYRTENKCTLYKEKFNKKEKECTNIKAFYDRCKYHEQKKKNDNNINIKGVFVMIQCEFEGIREYGSTIISNEFVNDNIIRQMNKIQKQTLLTACKISHSIAKTLNIEARGVRGYRDTKNKNRKAFITNNNKLAKNSMIIEYLYLSNIDERNKYDPEKMAQATFKGITENCSDVCDFHEKCEYSGKTPNNTDNTKQY
jgi:hypothetical protein